MKTTPNIAEQALNLADQLGSVLAAGLTQALITKAQADAIYQIERRLRRKAIGMPRELPVAAVLNRQMSRRDRKEIA